MPQKSNNNKEVDEFEVYALAKRIGITKDEMENMTYVSLINILISSVYNEDEERKPTQEDIDKVFG